MAKTATKSTEGLSVVKSATEQLETVSPTSDPEGRQELTEDPAESAKVESTRQNTEVSPPAGFRKGIALALHFGESVSEEVGGQMLTDLDNFLADMIQGAGLIARIDAKKHHSNVLVGSEAEVSKPIKRATVSASKILSADTYEAFQNAVQRAARDKVEKGTRYEDILPATKREARDSVLASWTDADGNAATVELLKSVLTDYTARLTE